MCGRYVSPESAAIEREFSVVRTDWQFAASYNVAPTQRVPIVAPEFYPAPEKMMPRADAFRIIHFPETFPAEEAARQAELLKRSYEHAVNNMRELSDLIQRSNGEALALLRSGRRRHSGAHLWACGVPRLRDGYPRKCLACGAATQ